MTTLTASMTYLTAEEFYEAADSPEYAIRDAEYASWLAWGTEDGEWYAVRPPSEGDEPTEADPFRPVGPVHLDSLPLPWAAMALDDLQITNATTEES